MRPLAEQLETWVRVGVAEGWPADRVRGVCAPMLAHIPERAATGAAVLAVRGFEPERLLSRLVLPGRTEPGVLDPNHGPEGLAGYGPVEGVDVPETGAYVLLGVERGDEYRGLAPRDALADLARRGRTPLTIEEGIALVLVAPAMLERNHCFSLAGSRRGDRRVPALWIAAHAPKLGWCWEGTPHDWLGLASASGRVS